MSGHSKWHNIQKTKGAADAKRSAAFTKIAKEMIVAVKTGGSGDPANNSRLATVVAKAKAANMPNDNIKRTIEKALGSGNTDSFEKVVDEGYGPNRVAVGGGACSGMLSDAAAKGCDTFVTADVKYDVFLTARAMGINLIDAGHFSTEDVVCPVLVQWLAQRFPELEVLRSQRHKEVFSCL